MIRIFHKMNTPTMRHPLILLLCLSLVWTSCEQQQDTSKAQSFERIDWIHQVDSLIMPFWASPEALGDPVGNFPAYRYSDGRPVDPDNPDYSLLDERYRPFYFSSTDSLRRDFVRVKSRQIYGLCMAYHMTGNNTYLVYAKKALDHLIGRGVFDEPLPFSFWDRNGNPAPALFQRNPQDISYALMGPTMYYYLTRDPEVLQLLLRTHEFLWEEYYEKSTVSERTRLVQWVKEDFENDKASGRDLLAPLDMLNAYLLLLAHSAPDSVSAGLLEQASTLAYMMRDNFYDPEYNIFWSDLNNKQFAGNTDFPHSIKSFWMILTTGKMTGDQILIDFALSGGPRLLDTAWIPEKGRWAMRYTSDRYEKDLGIFTWGYNELDQMTATLSLGDTSYYPRFLHEAYSNYEKLLIDTVYKGAYSARDENDQVLDIGFRSGWFLADFHVMEHAFIGLLGDAHYYREPLELHYAIKAGQRVSMTRIHPYTYSGSITSKSESAFDAPELEGLKRTQVTFEQLR